MVFPQQCWLSHRYVPGHERCQNLQSLRTHWRWQICWMIWYRGVVFYFRVCTSTPRRTKGTNWGWASQGSVHLSASSSWCGTRHRPLHTITYQQYLHNIPWQLLTYRSRWSSQRIQLYEGGWVSTTEPTKKKVISTINTSRSASSYSLFFRVFSMIFLAT